LFWESEGKSMLMFETHRFGRPRQIDVLNLPLGATLAHKLPQHDLYRELKKLGVPGIAETDSAQDLCLSYGNFLQVQAEAAK
jgi:hypothetical protein